MRAYKDKEELKNEIHQSFEKYISEFDTIPEALKDKRVPGVDRTPAENLAYQVGWTTLLLKWETAEKRGMDVKTVGAVQVEPAGQPVSMVHGHLRPFVLGGIEGQIK